MKKFLKLMMAFAILGGCSQEAEPVGPTVEKGDVASASGKGDSDELDQMCEDLDREPGCDPCAVQGWYGDGSCDSFCPVRDTDCGIDQYSIRVTSAPELSASISVVYQSSKDSFSCTDLNTAELEFRRVPEEVREEPAGTCSALDDGSTQCDFTFDNELGDGCESLVTRFHLVPSDAEGTMDPWASLQFAEDEGLDPAAAQVVECHVIMGGRDGQTPTMQCGNDTIHHDPSGQAHIELQLRAEE